MTMDTLHSEIKIIIYFLIFVLILAILFTSYIFLKYNGVLS